MFAELLLKLTFVNQQSAKKSQVNSPMSEVV